MKYFILISSLALFHLKVFAYDWQRIDVPNASCADGSPYTSFFSDRNSEHLVIHFKEGNACWSERSCYRDQLANLTTVKNAKPGAFLGQTNSPIHDANILIVTYCTGDVYLGKHHATYGGKLTQHNGDGNTKALFSYLENQNFFSQYTKVSIHGTSAGAIGALHHMPNLASLFSPLVDKTLLLEGVGLHYGSNFWKKFPADYINDFSDSLLQFQILLDVNNGNVSNLIPTVCSRYSDWHIGTILGSRDLAMSVGFGNIDPFSHESLVYSDQGLWGHTKDTNDNCSAFIPSTFKHTFLKDESKWNVTASGERSRENITVIDYAKRVIFEREADNFK